MKKNAYSKSSNYKIRNFTPILDLALDEVASANFDLHRSPKLDIDLQGFRCLELIATGPKESRNLITFQSLSKEQTTPPRVLFLVF